MRYYLAMTLLIQNALVTIPEEEDGNNSQSSSLTTSTSTLSDQNEGVSVIWKDLTVEAEIKKQNIFKPTTKSFKPLIRNVSGVIFPGSLVAILGASGAGKTTLMSALANRCPSSFRIEGDIRIHNQSSEKFDKRLFRYVYQDDLFIPCLTIMEHMNFVAKLRLDKNINREDRQRLILEVLREIGLLELANSRIGDINFGAETLSLSGGERKRLSLATELLTQPILLFCDEPTTGLDSFNALKITTTLKSLTINHKRTIICSIHQPSQKIIESFDQIILLCSGRIVFNGSVEDAKVFFQSKGYQYENDQNPAEYLIKSMATEESQENDTKCSDLLHDAFWRSEYSLEMRTYIDTAMKQNSTGVHLLKNIKLENEIQPPCWFSRFITILHRSFVCFYRTSSIHKLRVIENMLIGILIGLCVQGTVKNTQPGLAAFKGTVCTMFELNFYGGFYFGLFNIVEHLPIFYREYSNGSVTPSMFYLCNVITRLPFNLLEPQFYALEIYYLAGLRSTVYAVVMANVVNILLYNVTLAMGALSSSLFKDFITADVCCNPILNTLCYGSGLFIKLSSLPFLMAWMKYVSWLSYAYAVIYTIQWEDVYDIQCESNVNIPCLRTGREVLRSLDFDTHSLIYNLSMMILIYFIFHIAAYIALLFRIKSRNV